MESSTDYFISLIECNRVLYDKNSKDFKNTIKKDEAWARIARNCKTSVEDAKKRYASLRQKYCREKQKIEIQRRTKSKPFNPWVFYDRFQFLDEYIRPRTTYTNDSGFEDINGGSYPDDHTTMSLTGQNDSTKKNHTEIAGSSLDDGNVASNDVESNEERIVQYNLEDVQDSNSFQFIDNSGNVNIAVISEYSGDLSTYVPPAMEIDETETSVRDATDNSASSPRRDNSSNRNILQTLTNADARNIPTSSQRDSFRLTQEPTTKKAPAMKSNAHLERAHNNIVEPLPTPSNLSKEQSTDSMRLKLDSCIASLSAKISEKQHRSPHAPFLAYLGTKLPNVPKAELPALEKRILDLVDSFSP